MLFTKLLCETHSGKNVALENKSIITIHISVREGALLIDQPPKICIKYNNLTSKYCNQKLLKCTQMKYNFTKLISVYFWGSFSECFMVYIYIYICIYMCVCVIYIYIPRKTNWKSPASRWDKKKVRRDKFCVGCSRKDKSSSSYVIIQTL